MNGHTISEQLRNKIYENTETKSYQWAETFVEGAIHTRQIHGREVALKGNPWFIQQPHE